MNTEMTVVWPMLHNSNENCMQEDENVDNEQWEIKSVNLHNTCN